MGNFQILIHDCGSGSSSGSGSGSPWASRQAQKAPAWEARPRLFKSELISQEAWEERTLIKRVYLLCFGQVELFFFFFLITSNCVFDICIYFAMEKPAAGHNSFCQLPRRALKLVPDEPFPRK